MLISIYRIVSMPDVIFSQFSIYSFPTMPGVLVTNKLYNSLGYESAYLVIRLA